MEQKPKQVGRMEERALSITRWIGSPQSLVVHTLAFIASFAVVALGYLQFDRMLLVLTTIVSLEAIYLSLFIQMTVNYQAESLEEVEQDIDEIQEDVGEIQEDIDELQEDVEEISEEEAAEAARDVEDAKALGEIKDALRKLLDDVERLQQRAN